MTAITEARTFDATVNMYDLLDPVLGGLTGESNDPIIALANRSRYLYDYKNGFTAIATVSANTSIGVTYLRKLIYITGSANVTLTMAAIAGFVPGQTLHFKCAMAVGKCASIFPTGGENIKDGGLAKNFWLYAGEELSVTVVSSTDWEVTHSKGNFDIAGNDGMVRKQPRNSLIADGTAGYLRADYPRLWEQVNADSVADSTWLTDPLNYRGLFSQGNGTTTFRVPDMRSMFWRGLDLGRAVTFSRISTVPGGYEPDGFESHNHINGAYSGLLKADGFGTVTAFDNEPTLTEPNLRSRAPLLPAGGTETKSKNVGLIPIIYF